MVAFVNSAFEEASVRYVREIFSTGRDLAVVRPLNILDSSTQTRVAAIVPEFSMTEAMSTISKGEVTSFFESVVVANLKRGVAVWLEVAPEISGNLERGLEIHFLGNGFLILSHDGPTKFLASREAMRGAYVRFRPTAREFTRRRSIEIKVFERYATFHVGMAKIIEFEKKTPDWKLRARGEYYAALKKVEWRTGLYEKVCVEDVSEKSNATALEKPEPLDVCTETAWFHRP